MKTVRLFKAKFPKTTKNLWSLAEFLDDNYRLENLDIFYKFITGEIFGTGTNRTSITRNNNCIIISSDYSGTPDIEIPCDKFKQLIDKLSSLSLPKNTEEIIFKFDSKWNCEIEIIK